MSFALWIAGSTVSLNSWSRVDRLCFDNLHCFEWFSIKQCWRYHGRILFVDLHDGKWSGHYLIPFETDPSWCQRMIDQLSWKVETIPRDGCWSSLLKIIRALRGERDNQRSRVCMRKPNIVRFLSEYTLMENDHFYRVFWDICFCFFSCFLFCVRASPPLAEIRTVTRRLIAHGLTDTTAVKIWLKF